MHGVIAPHGEVSAEKVIGGLQDAFKDKNTKGVILRINSPGGSPVQAGYIYDEVLMDSFGFRVGQYSPDVSLR